MSEAISHRTSSSDLPAALDVLSVVPRTERDDGHNVLLGVRSQDADSRHAGSLSTLTRGIPRQVFDLISGVLSSYWEEGTRPLSAQRPVRIGQGDHDQEPGAMAIENLLATKVGLADALTMRRFRGMARLAAIACAKVGDNATEEWQNTRMLTYILDIEAGEDAIPLHTPAYDPLTWVDQARIPEAIESKNPFMLDKNLDLFRVCMEGICLRTFGDVIGNDGSVPYSRRQS